MAPRSSIISLMAATVILIPGIQAGLLRRDEDFPKWEEANPFFIDQDSCATLGDGSVDQASALYDAATDANYLAHAGIMAAQHPTLPPFNAFFREQDSATVIKNLQTIIDITDKSPKLNTHIVFNCNSERYCKEDRQWGAAVFFGRHVAGGPPEEERSNWEVSICNHGLNSLPRNPPACSGTVGLPSRGWVGIKYLLQLWDLIQPTIGNYRFGPLECRDLLLDDPAGPVLNAESYAYMASAAYDLGLYSGGPYKGPECRDRWADPATIALPSWAADGVTEFHTDFASSAALQVMDKDEMGSSCGDVYWLVRREGVGWVVNENDKDTAGVEKDREREDKKKSLGKKIRAMIVE